MIIYKITNKFNNKIYIGQTIQRLSKRWGEHCSKSKKHISAITEAIQKYGKDNFEIKIIAKANSIEELNHREQYYIKLFNCLTPNGYNLVSGGKNKICSAETRHKLSIIHKNKVVSEETKNKLRVLNSGANSHRFGTKHSSETKLKMSRSHTLNNHMTGKVGFLHHSGVRLICINDNNMFGSINEAANYYNIAPTPIQLLLQGKRKKLRCGLMFERLNDTIKDIRGK